jgi:hypothetical protein
MLERLQYNNEEGRDVRAELDAWLEVPRWRTPMSRAATYQRRAAIDAPELTPPTWWESDEEASASFLQAMGVSLEDGG